MSAFDRAMETIHKIHSTKAADYTAGVGEFHNYEMAAREANISTEQFLEGLIANKNERRKSIEYCATVPNHESLTDTLLDRAVFAIIRYAHHLDSIEVQQKIAYGGGGGVSGVSLSQNNSIIPVREYEDQDPRGLRRKK